MTDVSSYVRGADTLPLLDLTIGQALDDTVQRWGSRDAIISMHQRTRLSYSALKTRAEAFAAGLLALGLERGDRVGIWSPNNVEWALTQFATAIAGIILVNINPAYRISELEYTLNKVKAKALVTVESFRTSRYLDMIETLVPEIARGHPGELKAVALPHLRAAIKIGGDPRLGWIDFDAIAGLGRPAHAAKLKRLVSELHCDDAINIQFTSGTTGLPKGATLSHRNILNNGRFAGRAMALSENDRICIPVPLYHCFGMVLGNLACLVHGSAMVYPSAGFEPAAVLEAVEKEHCTGLYGVPTMFIAELEHPDFPRSDLISLRTGIMAGAPCPIEVMKAAMERMHMRDITIAYGMTETSPISFQTSSGDPVERRVATVGKIQPHLDAKIVDAKGRTMGRDRRGELLVRGYSIMKGYWDEPERTAEAIDSEGWMHSGDLAEIDREGYCRIVGRVKDMVIRGGENIYPREVEEYLHRHPAVEDVQVFGVPDEKYGEELCAWIKVRRGHRLDEDSVRAFCREKIAHYKIPRYVAFVDAFPLTATGKIQKFAMRDAMIEKLASIDDDARNVRAPHTIATRTASEYRYDSEAETMSRDAIAALQLKRLQTTLKCAYVNVPAYRAKFDAAGVRPEDLKQLEDLAAFPFTTKADLRDAYPFGLFAVPLEKVMRLHASSGTTGKPTVVGYTPGDIDRWADLMARSLATAGGRPGDIFHNAYGYGLFTGGLGMHDGAQRLGGTVVPASGGGTERQIALLRDFGATVLCATPSYALNLSEVAAKHGIDLRSGPLRLGVFGAEPWSAAMRAELESRLGVVARDVYGLSEIMGPGVAIECAASDGIHGWEDHFLFEVIDPKSGRTLPPGEMGELVITTLTKEALPMIRYRTRDITKLNFAPCACDRNHVRFMRITGRDDDMLIIRGVNVYPTQIEAVLVSMPDASPHYQILLERKGALDSLTVEVEASPGLDAGEYPRLADDVTHLVKSLIGVTVAVAVREPGTLPRSAGKAVRVRDLREKV